MTITLHTILKLATILTTVVTLLLIILDIIKVIETPASTLIMLTAISSLLIAVTYGAHKSPDENSM